MMHESLDHLIITQGALHGSAPWALLVHKENHRLCRWEKIAYGEGKSRQEKVSELK
jgi:hypothetical protein